METNRRVTIPFAMKKNEETGRLDNLRKAAGLMEGRYEGRRFNDTDVYKVVEGTCYSLALNYDAKLDKQLDEIIAIIAAAQEEDGYLYAARTVDPKNPAPGAGRERWIHLNGSHELYNSGHMFEAAVAHYQATGKRSFLNVAIKNADLLCRVFGPAKRQDAPGHQEVELALAKLYRVTGKKEYIELAKFFLDQRGREHDSELYPEDSNFAIYNGKGYKQDHIPVLEQAEAVGHAVRATYMYTGMADVAALTGDEGYTKAIDKLWENVVGKKMYLTGGVGARHTTEDFGDNYELPNRRAYTETCAAIGFAFWNHRMFLLHGEGKYIDVLERLLYNGVLSGVSLAGDRFFYQNPLESTGNYQRSEWFDVSCCPGNVVRFLPSVGGFVYAQRDDQLYINLFMSSTAEIGLENNRLKISQETNYPWDQKVKIRLEPQPAGQFAVNIRIPGWARNQPAPSDLYRYIDENKERISLKVNGAEAAVKINKGFVLLEREWRRGDTIELDLPMPVRRVSAHEAVMDDRGKVALERGPLVYCVEGVDNGGQALNLILADEAVLRSEFRKEMLGGIQVITGEGLIEKQTGREKVNLIAIPYYAWAHRGAGEMTVWLKKK